jgi:hypothetical protein
MSHTSPHLAMVKQRNKQKIKVWLPQGSKVETTKHTWSSTMARIDNHHLPCLPTGVPHRDQQNALLAPQHLYPLYIALVG